MGADGVRHRTFFCKKLFISLAVLVVSRVLIYASDISIFIEPIVSYNYESTSYYLYDSDGSLNSRLDWNSLYLFKTGAGMDIHINSFIVHASAMFNLPFECGKMYDSDWRSVGIKTNLSESDLYAGLGFDACVDLGYRFIVPNGFSICPFFSIQDSYKKLSAKNTIGWCGDTNHTGLSQNVAWDDARAKQVKKYGIDFYNNVTGFYLGVGISKTFSRTQFDFTALVSPFTYIISVDHHLNKEAGHFYQLVQNAVSYEFRFSGICNINDIFAIKLWSQYHFCPLARGQFYYGWFGAEKLPSDDTSGFKFSHVSAAVSLQIKIL